MQTFVLAVGVFPGFVFAVDVVALPVDRPVVAVDRSDVLVETCPAPVSV